MKIPQFWILASEIIFSILNTFQTFENYMTAYMKDPAKGQEQAISGNTNPYIFLPIRDTPMKCVYWEKAETLKISKISNELKKQGMTKN